MAIKVSDFGPNVEALFNRLKKVGELDPPADRPRVEEALTRHFAALKLDKPKFIWAQDAVEFYILISQEASSNVHWAPVHSGAWGACRAIMWAATEYVTQEKKTPIHPPSHGELEEMCHRSSMSREQATAGSETLERAKRIAGTKQVVAKKGMPRNFKNAASPQYEGAKENLAAKETKRAGMWKTVWVPMLEAYEAGLWAYSAVESAVILLDRPIIKTEIANNQTRLHNETGPAITWRNPTYKEADSFYWRGIPVDRHVIMEPEKITYQEIEKQQNAEVRRVMMERFGLSKYLMKSGAKEIHKDDWGTLYRKDVPGDEPLVMVKVVNSTAEPDGTFKDYFLRVPPHTRTAREAIAWTFEKTETTYKPVKQT